MPHITTTNRPIFFATENAGAVIHAGQVEVGGAIGSPLTLTTDTDENAYLGKVAGKGGSFKPENTPALFCVYRAGAGALEWVAGESVMVGTRRTYGGKTYEAIQAHVTQNDWIPPAVPALWREVVETPVPGAWAVGVAYKVGDRVTYQGGEYRCRQAHTSIATWTPAAVPALWEKL